MVSGQVASSHEVPFKAPPLVQVQGRFAATETALRTVRDGEPWMATATFPQLPSSVVP